MSNACKYTTQEINKAVEALVLPAPLQGIEEWKGSREIGGNVAAHLAAVNGKALAIGVCQVFGDWYFGADSRANILKGIRSVRTRGAFDAATADVVRLNKPIASADMLAFYRAFEQARMEATPATKVSEGALAPAAPVETPKAETLGHAAAIDTLKGDRLKTAHRIRALRASNRALRAQLAEALAMLAVSAAKTKRTGKAKQAA